MDAPPPHEDVRPFIHIDEHLRNNNLSAPEIYAQDSENGFLLLEDFGHDSYTNILSHKIDSQPTEALLYEVAIDALIDLHHMPLPSGVSEYNTATLLKEVSLLPQWFLPHMSSIGADSADAIDEATESYLEIWKDLIKKAAYSPKALVLRDYHADNLMWLPQRKGSARAGLLDFQDALIGSPAYDIISLIEDARRDVAPQTAAMAFERYLNAFDSLDKDAFLTEASLLAAQRNCKIIGIFARLAIRDNKPHYLNYLPRVWGHLKSDLKHPSLEALDRWFERYGIIDVR
jgi:hypothetical protein